MLKNKDFYFALKPLGVVFIMLINVKMPTIAGILAFMSRINSMLSSVYATFKIPKFKNSIFGIIFNGTIILFDFSDLYKDCMFYIYLNRQEFHFLLLYMN